MGVWWLPSNPEEKLEGTLSISNEEGINLKVAGVFTNTMYSAPIPIILGKIVNVKPEVTLCDCQRSTYAEGFLPWRQRWTPSKVLFGYHFNSPEEILFQKARLKYTHLTDFTGLGGFDLEESTNEKGHCVYKATYTPGKEAKAKVGKAELSIDYTPDPEIGFINIDPTQLHLSETINESVFRFIELHQNIAINIETEERIPFDEWLSKFIYPIQNLLTFATATPNQLTEFIFRDPMRSVEVLFKSVQNEASINRRADQRFQGDMLFTLSEIDDFSKTIERWLRISTELEIVYGLFFDAYYNSNMNEHHKFFNLMQVLESYHRERFFDKRQAFSSGDYDILKNILTKAISDNNDKYGEWLERKLKNGNEVSLRRRLKDLMMDDYTKEIISPLIGKKDSFIASVIDTRNYLTHRDTNLQSKILKNKELVKATEVLFYLLQIWFLKELGFPPEKTVKLFKNYRPYYWRLSELEFEQDLKRGPSI